jgi:hypothetical protein
MTTGTGAMNRVLLAVGALPTVRLFRNNTGMGWAGKVKKLGPSRVLIEDARPLHAGLVKGSSDLVGWTSRKIEPRHVGETWAVFTALEVKDGSGRLSEDQERFLRAVQRAGGIAEEVRSGEDALEALGLAEAEPVDR